MMRVLERKVVTGGGYIHLDTRGTYTLRTSTYTYILEVHTLRGPAVVNRDQCKSATCCIYLKGRLAKPKWRNLSIYLSLSLVFISDIKLNTLCAESLEFSWKGGKSVNGGWHTGGFPYSGNIKTI